MLVALGLGSNVENRKKHLKSAVSELENLLGDLKKSPIYENPAMLPENAPKEWDTPFLNMVVTGECSFEPGELFNQLKAIEKTLGRKHRGIWGPREIDIDLLLYANHSIKEPDLCVPHSGMLARDFVLKPLADIAPEWIFPSGEYKGKTIADLIVIFGYCECSSLVKI